jgi:hypothetical protein
MPIGDSTEEPTMLRQICGRLMPLLILLAPVPLLSQSVPELLAHLKSAREAERIEAFYKLLGASTHRTERLRVDMATEAVLRQNPALRTEISRTLIALLEAENARVHSAAIGSMSAGYGEFHGDVIWSVGTLRNPGAAKALAGALGTGGLAVRGLAKLGVPAISTLADAAASAQVPVRFDALTALSTIARNEKSLNITAPDLARIASVLQKAVASDRSPDVRIKAIEGLAGFTDAGTRALMAQVAATDTATLIRNGSRIYPVREKATDWLRARAVKP